MTISTRDLLDRMSDERAANDHARLAHLLTCTTLRPRNAQGQLRPETTADIHCRSSELSAEQVLDYRTA